MHGSATFGGIAGAIAICALLIAAPDAASRVVKAPVFYIAPENTADTDPFFQRAGLRLTGACADGGDNPVPTITVTSGADNAMVHVNAQAPMALAYAEDDDFDQGDSFSLFGSLGINAAFVGGQLVFSRPDGRHVTVTWGRTPALELGQPQRCALFGIARIASRGRDPRTRKRIDFRAGEGAKKRVLRAGGLALRARCTDAGRLGVVARTGVDHSVLGANVQAASFNDVAVDGNLREREGVDLFGRLGGGRDDAVGQLVYANPRGSVVSVDWLAEEADAYGGRRACAFVGTARITGERSRERLYFARRRSRPFLTPRQGARGVPAPDYERVLSQPPFELFAACAHPQGGDGRLFGRAAVAAAGAAVGAEQAAAEAEIMGGTSALGSSFLLLSAPTRSVGHAAAMTTTGAMFATSWLAQQHVALGKPARRKLCLLAGTTERIPAP